MTFSVRLWGDLACFTRPENKVERFSYPLITPSAARGALEAIFWKPEFAWVVEAIDVIRSGSYVQIMRNELQSRISPKNAREWATKRAGYGNYSVEGDRTQRYTLALRDVEYVVHAHMQLRPHASNVVKYQDQMRRRLKRGQCFQQPYLGLREFPARFAAASGDERREPWSADLGLMLLDIDYVDGRAGGEAEFFEAAVRDGRLEVPEPRWLARRLGEVEMEAKED